MKVPLSTPDSTRVAVALKLPSTTKLASTVSFPCEGQLVVPGDTMHEFEKIAIVPEYFAGSAVVTSAPEKVPVPSLRTSPETVLLVVSIVPVKFQFHGPGRPQETQNQSMVIESPVTVPVKPMVCHWLPGTTPGVPGGYRDGHPEVRACIQ